MYLACAVLDHNRHLTENRHADAICCAGRGGAGVGGTAEIQAVEAIGSETVIAIREGEHDLSVGIRYSADALIGSAIKDIHGQSGQDRTGGIRNGHGYGSARLICEPVGSALVIADKGGQHFREVQVKTDRCFGGE